MPEQSNGMDELQKELERRIAQIRADRRVVEAQCRELRELREEYERKIGELWKRLGL